STGLEPLEAIGYAYEPAAIHLVPLARRGGLLHEGGPAPTDQPALALPADPLPRGRPGRRADRAAPARPPAHRRRQGLPARVRGRRAGSRPRRRRRAHGPGPG